MKTGKGAGGHGGLPMGVAERGLGREPVAMVAYRWGGGIIPIPNTLLL